jgi:diguanylate cyclase (GGDEF)-like protein
MKILVVDSDQLFARLIKTKLTSWGHTVVVENDGNAALARITKEAFRMVILERDLPGMDGLELARRIRNLKRSRYTYIMFYTSHAEDNLLVDCLRAGGDEYLTKPLNTVDLQLRLKARKRLFNVEDSLRDGQQSEANSGVVNVGSFREFFRVALAQAQQLGTQGYLLYVDVSNYRDIQAAFGVAPAESLMVEVAKMMRRLTTDSDLIGRIAEDCFCVLVQNAAPEQHRELSAKIEAQAQAITVVTDDSSIYPSITLGLLEFPHADMTYRQILDDLHPVHCGANATVQPTMADPAATASNY